MYLLYCLCFVWGDRCSVWATRRMVRARTRLLFKKGRLWGRCVPRLVPRLDRGNDRICSAGTAFSRRLFALRVYHIVVSATVCVSCAVADLGDANLVRMADCAARR